MLNLPALTAFSFNETCPFILLQTWTFFSHLIKQIQLLRNLCLVFFFLLYRKHPNSSDCYCVGYFCDWVELQNKQACFLFLQNLCSGLRVPGRWFLNTEREVVWLFLPYVLQFYFVFSKGQIHLGEAPWHCKVLPPHLSYCFPVLPPLQQHKTHIPKSKLLNKEQET